MNFLFVGELIESEIGQLLRAFLVDNFNDKKVLDSITRRVGIDINIITSKYANRLYDVSQGACETDNYPSIFNLLQIKNPNVANCLIDQKKIERIILMPRDRDAQELLKSTKSAPRNCLYALTGDMNQFYPAPSYRSYAINKKGGRNVLKSSVSEHLEKLKQDLEMYKKEQSEAENVLEEQQVKLNMHNKEVQNSKKICSQSSNEIKRICHEIFRIGQIQDEAKPVDISALEDDAERFQEEIDKFEAEMAGIEEEVKIGKIKVEEAQQKYRQKEEEIEERENSSDPLEEKLAKIERKIANCTQEKDKHREKLKKTQGRQEIAETEMKNFKEKLKKIVEELQVMGGELIETKRSAETIKNEAKSLEDSIKRQESVHEPKHVVEKRIEKLKADFEFLRDNINYFHGFVKNLKYMVKEREGGFIQIRGSMCRRVKMAFAYRLSQRNFNGSLEFDHQNETLSLAVSPEGREFVQKRDMKTLSGGEKSFSTVSLILALWECIQPPFRMLDEFDVFMDMMNRNKSVQMMLEYAQNIRRFQYFFLTPLDTGSIKEDADVAVRRVIKNNG